jgi:hypothetical protein
MSITVVLVVSLRNCSLKSVHSHLTIKQIYYVGEEYCALSAVVVRTELSEEIGARSGYPFIFHRDNNVHKIWSSGVTASYNWALLCDSALSRIYRNIVNWYNRDHNQPQLLR